MPHKKEWIKKMLVIMILLMTLSMILAYVYDDTKAEDVFRWMWIVLMFISTVLRGIWVIYDEQNRKAGYFYFVLAIVFILLILYIRY